MASLLRGFALGLLFSVFVCGRVSWARHADSENDLQSRIEHENNPVKKAKYQIRFGRVKLLAAIGAYNQGNVDEGHKLLGAYLEQMKHSWETLRSSGRRATRHSEGFKELDIALREDARLLEDLKRKVPFTDRDPVDKTAREAEQIRGEVLRALFPSGQPSACSNSFLPRGPLLLTRGLAS